MLAVFRLSTQKLEKGASPPWKDNKDCFLYALSTGEESFSTAQERALAHLRDGKDNYPMALACDVIAPAEAVQSLMDQRPETVSVVTETALEAPRVAHKATTAAAFFGKKKESDKVTTAKTSKSTISSKTTSSTKSSSNNKSSKSSATVPSMFQRAAAAVPSRSNKPKATVEQDEKENNKRPKLVGNADDFVGDEEESDDEVQMDTKPVNVRGRAVPDDEAMIHDDEEEEETKEEKAKAKPTIYGAMDDFAKPKEKAAPQDEGAPKRRRRRKRLVEKTTIDKSGYLHTETQEIWEDIPTDEEEEEAPKKVKPAAPVVSRPKKKVVKPSGMKQGKLNFFVKKK